MAWTPQQEGLQQILQVLRNTNSPDNAIQQQVRQKLQEFNQVPDFNNYLMYILTQSSTEMESVRAVAGILLKNNILSGNVKLTQDVLAYLQQACLQNLGDPQPLVRNTITSLMTSLVTRTGVMQWTNLLPTILQNLDSLDYNLVEGAFGALEKILEDSGQEFRSEQLKQHTDFITKKLIAMTDSQHAKIRIYALTCYNFLIQYHVSPAFQHMNDYIGALSKRATDQVGDVRALVCRAFVHILDSSPEVLLPGIQSIADFMIFSAQDENSAVALDACEFWLAFAEHEELKDHLEALVPRLIPILMKQMVYSDYDIAVLGDNDEEDEAVPDRDQDIKPRHYKAKTHSVETVKTNGTTNGNTNEEDSEDEEEDDEIYAEWNLRKCSAATLDVLSNAYGNNILEFLLPILNQQLFHADWKVREAGVLALGAIAEGCMTGIEPHLIQLIPFLFQMLREPKPLLRSITCWTLGRYCIWCLSQDPKVFLEPMIKGILDMVLDRNKRVQEAACSALATLEEEAGEMLTPYVEPILVALTTAFGKYQSRNLLILYDAIGTLSECVGDSIGQPKYVEMIMNPLIQKWQSHADDDTGLFPLLECLSSVASAVGPAFTPYAEPVFQRCVRLVKKTLQEKEMYSKNPNSFDPPDMDFMIVALDLLSGVIQGVSDASIGLIDKEADFFPILFVAMKDEVDEVRQSSFALVGDLAISCFERLRPHLPTMLPFLVQQCRPTQESSISSANNACWATGEIALRYGKEMEQYCPVLLQQIIPILNMHDMPRTMRENAAITIGRIGITLPNLIAPHLAQFADSWCKSLRMSRDNAEKESAFLGFCNIVLANPHGLANSLALFCEAVVNWQTPSPTLVEGFKQVLHGYKSMMGAEWGNFIATFPPNLRDKLVNAYQLQ